MYHVKLSFFFSSCSKIKFKMFAIWAKQTLHWPYVTFSQGDIFAILSWHRVYNWAQTHKIVGGTNFLNKKSTYNRGLRSKEVYLILASNYSLSNWLWFWKANHVLIIRLSVVSAMPHCLINAYLIAGFWNLKLMCSILTYGTFLILILFRSLIQCTLREHFPIGQYSLRHPGIFPPYVLLMPPSCPGFSREPLLLEAGKA
jgi:hypothetical protein